MGPEATWLLPVMFKKIVEFRKTLVEEPPIQLGIASAEAAVSR